MQNISQRSICTQCRDTKPPHILRLCRSQSGSWRTGI